MLYSDSSTSGSPVVSVSTSKPYEPWFQAWRPFLFFYQRSCGLGKLTYRPLTFFEKYPNAFLQNRPLGCNLVDISIGLDCRVLRCLIPPLHSVEHESFIRLEGIGSILSYLPSSSILWQILGRLNLMFPVTSKSSWVQEEHLTYNMRNNFQASARRTSSVRDAR